MSWHVSVSARIGDLEMHVEVEGADHPIAIIGPNGCGKTTLLRMVAGAHRPLDGEISVDGHTFFSSRQAVDLAVERRRVGYLPQGYGLFPHLRAVENVAFGLSSIPRGERRHRAEQMLGELGCEHLAARFPNELSGGEAQRVALARALVIDPSILLLDEPLSALDAAARARTRRFLASYLSEQERPAIVVTHDVRDVEALDAQVYAIERGHVVQRGTLAELCAAPATDFVAEFVGSRPVDLPE